MFAHQFIRAQIKENIKAPRHWPLCGEFTGDRWWRHHDYPQRQDGKVETPSHWRQWPFTLHSQYHGCCWQAADVTIGYNFGIARPGYFGVSTEKFKLWSSIPFCRTPQITPFLCQNGGCLSSAYTLSMAITEAITTIYGIVGYFIFVTCYSYRYVTRCINRFHTCPSYWWACVKTIDTSSHNGCFSWEVLCPYSWLCFELLSARAILAGGLTGKLFGGGRIISRKPWRTWSMSCISNYIHHEEWDQITYPFPNFNGAAVEVWEWG